MIAYTESCPVRQGVFNGGIAQLARACGSYPQCPRFKSRCRYQTPKDGTAPSFGTSLQEYPAPLGQPGPLVKWLRHRPFTAVTRVRVPYGSPIYGGVAQPVEHLLHTQGVTDSSSVVSTRTKPCSLNDYRVFCLVFLYILHSLFRRIWGHFSGLWGQLWGHNLSSLINKRGPPARARGPPFTHDTSRRKRERMIVVPISYFMFRRKKYAPEIGTYYSYDIVVYGLLHQGPVQILQDVSTDAERVFRMVMAFNRYSLSPLHLKDAVLDMLE